jgi:hypothetical protein
MDTKDLIAAAQRGDELATNKLLKIIQTEHMPRRIRRFIKRNVLVTQDEIESEFLLGCWRAIQVAKLDIGNPMMFIGWKGELAVTHMFRKKIREGVRVNCTTCGVGTIQYKRNAHTHEERLRGAKAPIACSKCGATDVDTFMIVMDESQMKEEFEGGAPSSAMWDKIDIDHIPAAQDALFENITHDIVIEEIRCKLNGRVLQLFDKLVLEQVNRDTSVNYLAEIAREWGVSTACVSVYLRKLRIKVIEYLDERGADLPDSAPRVAA